MERTGYHHDHTPGELTDRQRLVLERIADGRTNGEIATELGLTIDGVKWHVREIFDRLNVSSREEAADWWRRERSWSHRLAAVPASLAVAAPVGSAVVGAVGLAVLVVAVVLATGAGLPGAFGGDDTEQQATPTAAPDAETPTSEATPDETPTAAPTASPTAEPTATSEPTAPPMQAHPDSARTGEAVVDNFLEAREQLDAGAIAAMIAYTEMECTTQPSIGSMPCREGEADGTVVQAVRVNGGCEPVFARPDGVMSEIEHRVLGQDYRLHGIVGGDDSATVIYGDAVGHHAMFVAIGLDSGRIEAIGLSCGELADELFDLLVNDGADVLLAPL